ncbi:MAG: ABC transporter permease [Planctomycetota bacterium]|nr:ABC transporter permease [Planctomycetota bacterium]
MSYLPLANILHHKLRSALSAMGIAIGICMLVTLSGLSRGSLYEIADRWEEVDAELIIYPEIWGRNLTTLSGSALPDRYGDKIAAEHSRLIERVVPVFLWPIRLAGQDQTVVGVDPQNFNMLVGGRRLRQGRLFDPDGRFAGWLENTLLAPAGEDQEIVEITKDQLADTDHNGLEMVIDTRLATAGGYRLGQKVFTANHHFTIVGIVPAGGLARAFMPRRTAQFLFGNGDITKSTLMFIKLAGGGEPAAAARKIKRPGTAVMQVDQYRGMLKDKFGIMFTYVDAVNVVAMVIAFLFIMITLYTMVLQRTREIAILKSSGASNFFLIRQVWAESMLLTAAGAAAGVALSFLAGWGIEACRPLLTVTITWWWIAVAAAAALLGAAASSLYPAWRATRIDMLEALRFE